MAYKDKEKQRAFSKQHYEANKEIYANRRLLNMREIRKRNRDYINSFLLKNPCIDCGEKDIIVLEFDHVRGNKLTAVSSMISQGFSIKKIKLEIDKCEVRCANCHRRVTSKRRNIAI